MQIEKLNDLEDEVEKAKLKAKEIVEEAERDAVSKAKEIELKAKEKAYQIKEEVEKEARNSKNEIAQKEARIIKKEEILDEVNSGANKTYGSFWYFVGKFIYVPIAFLLCIIAISKGISF